MTEHEAAYGQSSIESFANYDRDTCSWKTSQHSLFGGWAEFWATWPRAGMMRNGMCYQLVPLVPDISVKGFGYYPTPTKSDHKGASLGCQKIKNGELSMLRYYLFSLEIDPGCKTLYPHPEFVEWLMGYPIGHTELPP